MKKIIFLMFIFCAHIICAADEGKSNKSCQKTQDYRVAQDKPLAKDFLKIGQSDRYETLKNLVNGLSRTDKERLFKNLDIELRKDNGCYTEPCEGCKMQLPFDQARKQHYIPSHVGKIWAALLGTAR